MLFFFSMSDPVSLRTKTRTRQNRGRSSVLAAWRAPVPTPHGVAAAAASSPGAPYIQEGFRKHLDTGALPPGQASALGALSASMGDNVTLQSASAEMSKFGQTSNFSAECKVPVDQPQNLQ